MSQHIIYINDNCDRLDEYIGSLQVSKILLVCGSSIRFLKYDAYFEDLPKNTGIKVVRFSDFTPNPTYEAVVRGVDLFHNENCDMIIAVGGGSAIDVAKCIKLFSNMELNDTIREDNNGIKKEITYLNQKIIPNNLKFMAIPTTAGTGSEATQFAVIYYDGEKKSVSDYSCIPSTVVMDSSVLCNLPLYQKKVTMLDALCHAVESFWSVNSTDESKGYSREAIKLILDNMDAYIGESVIDEDCFAPNENMQRAAYLAGRAINITMTTAGHAMCYKLTTLYGIAHGHAAAFCVAKLFPYMIKHTKDCVDARGQKYLDNMFAELTNVLGCNNTNQAEKFFEELIRKLELVIPSATDDEYGILRTSVNTERLKNNPVRLSEDQIDELYHEILSN